MFRTCITPRLVYLVHILVVAWIEFMWFICIIISALQSYLLEILTHMMSNFAQYMSRVGWGKAPIQLGIFGALDGGGRPHVACPF